jgi:PD-(D/E)XK nuclease superfamily
VSVGGRLGAALADWSLGRKSQLVPVEALVELRQHLEAVARAAAADVNRTGDQPLRLSKARIRQLLDCERHMLAVLAADAGDVSSQLALGTILDVLAGHYVTTQRLEDDPLATAVAVMEVSDEYGHARVLKWIEAQDPAMRRALATDVLDTYHTLLDEWPNLRIEWWPRVQDTAVLSLADGDVLIEGRSDLVLGGPPTSHRAAIIEMKSRPFRQEDLEDAVMYGLLMALRDAQAPDCVITCCAATGGVDALWIGEDGLQSATHRLGEAITRAAELAGGRTPTETPTPRCGWCPDQMVCPSVRTDVAATTHEELEESDDDPF